MDFSQGRTSSIVSMTAECHAARYRVFAYTTWLGDGPTISPRSIGGHPCLLVFQSSKGRKCRRLRLCRRQCSHGDWLDDSPHNTVKGQYHSTPFTPLEASRRGSNLSLLFVSLPWSRLQYRSGRAMYAPQDHQTCHAFLFSLAASTSTIHTSCDSSTLLYHR